MRYQKSVPYQAGAAVIARRFVKFSAANTVIQAAAATDKIVAVSDALGAAAAGDRCESYVGGIVEVEAGGAIALGDPITSDAVGRAVVAAPGAGVNNRIAGFSQSAAVLGDILEIMWSPGFMQG
jgi:hypothetical protein